MEKNRKYFEILELHPDATITDVRNAYMRLKDLYSSDSIVTSPIVDEFSEDSIQEILFQIEDAYSNLLAFFENREKSGQDVKTASGPGRTAGPRQVEVDLFTGEALKTIRESLNIGLDEIALATNIRMKHLENIELEKFSALPPEVYLRGFVIDYAKHLSLDPGKAAGDYIARYRKWKEKQGQ